MIIKRYRESATYYTFGNPEGTAMAMAQNPGEPYRLQLHSGGTEPEMYQRVSALLNGEHDCCMVHQGDTVHAAPRHGAAQ